MGSEGCGWEGFSFDLQRPLKPKLQIKPWINVHRSSWRVTFTLKTSTKTKQYPYGRCTLFFWCHATQSQLSTEGSTLFFTLGNCTLCFLPTSYQSGQFPKRVSRTLEIHMSISHSGHRPLTSPLDGASATFAELGTLSSLYIFSGAQKETRTPNSEKGR